MVLGWVKVLVLDLQTEDVEGGITVVARLWRGWRGVRAVILRAEAY